MTRVAYIFKHILMFLRKCVVRYRLVLIFLLWNCFCGKIWLLHGSLHYRPALWEFPRIRCTQRQKVPIMSGKAISVLHELPTDLARDWNSSLSALITQFIISWSSVTHIVARLQMPSSAGGLYFLKYASAVLNLIYSVAQR